MITIEQIASVPLSGSDFDETERLKAHFANLRGSRDPFYLDSDDFEEVLQWKLRSQYGKIIVCSFAKALLVQPIDVL